MIRVSRRFARGSFPAAVLASGLLAAPAAAEDLAEATSQLCAKVKGCVSAEIATATDMSDAQKAEATRSLDTMCAAIEQSFSIATRQHRLNDPALACVRSMNALDCAELMGVDGPMTVDCETFQGLAAAEGG
ncbi:hypothetical protein [Methylobrevis pamukkalensis]|uniref:Cysteine rich repeat protein n=1 Tax=Methylobrevis pamukkalensis TaxID=1439726 RepID=A0A1E3H174_9HYPH|nr:hypothetical protein [Methylobrevis pamukkalensis]ODN70044.1 hypothetical protein A6302_02641 [Methylobrevis pamukkalensis]